MNSMVRSVGSGLPRRQVEGDYCIRDEICCELLEGIQDKTSVDVERRVDLGLPSYPHFRIEVAGQQQRKWRSRQAATQTPNP
jgi:hypothetical protein